jgi:peptidyl-prolyl cis-trans isomerase C
MKKISIAVLALLMLLLMSGGCAKKEDFAIKVNGQSVSRATYENKLNAAKEYYKKMGIDLNGQQAESIIAKIQREVMDQLISAALIEEEVANNQWDTNDAAVTEKIEKLKEQLAGKDYDAWLKEQAMTNEEVVNYYTLFTNIGKDVSVTDKDVQDFFDANFASYGGQEEQVKARHILVPTEQEALDIIKELKAGADFAALAKEKSTDTGSKESGGDLGYFSKGRMVPEFEEAAFSQAKDQIPDKPVKTDYGYHIIMVEDHKQEIKPNFEEVKENVRNDALEYAKYQKFQTYFAQLHDKAKIEYASDLKPKEAE